jgi:hypothetical protein
MLKVEDESCLEYFSLVGGATLKRTLSVKFLEQDVFEKLRDYVLYTLRTHKNLNVDRFD